MTVSVSVSVSVWVWVCHRILLRSVVHRELPAASVGRIDWRAVRGPPPHEGAQQRTEALALPRTAGGENRCDLLSAQRAVVQRDFVQQTVKQRGGRGVRRTGTSQDQIGLVGVDEVFLIGAHTGR